jgi:hypothetical protein
MKAAFLFSAFALLFTGCVSGPRYEYTQQKDSARIEAPVQPIQWKETYGDCHVHINTVDGLISTFDASSPGLTLLGSTTPLYLSPGGHTLVVSADETDEIDGNVGGGRTGAVGYSSAGAKATITETFVANHVYRFTASIDPSNKFIALTLWDETGGSAKRSRVTSWNLNAEGAYSEATPPSGGRH